MKVFAITVLLGACISVARTQGFLERLYLHTIARDIASIAENYLPINFHFFRRDQRSICFGELGCFGKERRSFDYINLLPESPKKIDTGFEAFTREIKGISFTSEDVSPLSVAMNKTRPVAFIVHGFMSSATSSWVKRMRKAYLKAADAVVISVNWKKGARPSYKQAVVNTDLVGREIALVIQKMMENWPEYVDADSVHYIGHSLGAQTGRPTSEYLKELNGQTMGKITALDAASPLFEQYGVTVNETHARFVEAIHTSAGGDIIKGYLGVEQPIGDIDFYVNGGKDQNGCSVTSLTCNHGRAYQYYIEALRNTNCSFDAFTCRGGLSEYREGNCVKETGTYNKISLNETEDLPGRGVMIVETNADRPFCKEQEHNSTDIN